MGRAVAHREVIEASRWGNIYLPSLYRGGSKLNVLNATNIKGRNILSYFPE